jgi:hypothetical protein
MDEFEKRLESLRAPEASAPAFKEALRQRLLDSYDAVRAAAGMKRLLVASSTAAAVLLAVSAAFVAWPSVPAGINQRLGGAVARVDQAVPQAPAPGDRGLKPAAPPAPIDVRTVSGDPFVEGMEADRDLLERLLRESMQGRAFPRVRDAEMYTVGKYTLSNDKEIFVFTSVPREEARVQKTLY